jgi:alpha-amylase
LAENSPNPQVDLPDLKTEDPVVAGLWNDWVKGLVCDYAIDGFRMDTAQQISFNFSQDFVAAAGVHMLGEVFDSNVPWVCSRQTNLGMGVLNFPALVNLVIARNPANFE